MRIKATVFALFLLAMLPVYGDREGAAPETRDEVVARLLRTGAEALATEQSRDGSFKGDAGTTALCLYALAHAGRDPEAPEMQAALRYLLANQARPGNYAASLTVMALFTLDRELHAKRIRSLAALIARGQAKNGQWTYNLRGGRAGGDNSNTQFAVLALWYARRAGAEIDPEVFKRTLAFFETTQNDDGGWGYSDKERRKSYGTMVATGLTSLIVCRAGAERKKVLDLDLAADERVKKARGWLADHLALDRNPEAKFVLGGGRKIITESFYRHYWLWSLERGAAVAGITKLGERDWFDEGVKHLDATQRDDGSWVGSESPVLATAFAVLFLSRATRKAVVTEKAEVRGEVT